jgi:hypothetical protein
MGVQPRVDAGHVEGVRAGQQGPQLLPFLIVSQAHCTGGSAGGLSLFLLFLQLLLIFVLAFIIMFPILPAMLRRLPVLSPFGMPQPCPCPAFLNIIISI